VVLNGAGAALPGNLIASRALSRCLHASIAARRVSKRHPFMVIQPVASLTWQAGRPGVAGLIQGGFVGFARRVLAGWLRAMIGPWSLPKDRASAPAAVPTLGREELFPAQGCLSGLGGRLG
jgi:hypothetical protein